MDFKNKKMEIEMIKLKETLAERDKKISELQDFIDNAYPAITEFEIKKGWYGGGVSTYKVKIEVYAEDLTKLISLLTNATLSKRKYDMLRREIDNKEGGK